MADLLTNNILTLLPSINECRLTLETGVSISTTDQTGKTTVYLTPHVGNRLALYDGTVWKLYAVTADKSLALGTLTNAKNYDIFAYDSSGTVTLEFSAAWASDTARTDALTTQDGIPVKSGATTRRYLGTIRTTSTTTTEDSALTRYVWNASNRVERYMASGTVIDSHTYTTGSYREWHGGTNSVRVSFLAGDLRTPRVSASINAQLAASSGQTGYLGIGLNSTGTDFTPLGVAVVAPGATNQFRAAAAGSTAMTAVGHQQLIPIELGDASSLTFQVYAITGHAMM